MYIYISIFYISLAGIIAMIMIKRREVLSGQRTNLSSLGYSLDNNLHNLSQRIRLGIRYFNRKTLFAIFNILAYHVLLRVRKIYVEIKHRTLLNPHGKKLIDAVRGRGEVRNHGASFYLRRISDK